MTMLSRQPRQIIAFSVNNSIKSKYIQVMVDSVGDFARNFTDGSKIYQDVIFGGKHFQNVSNTKCDTGVAFWIPT